MKIHYAEIKRYFEGYRYYEQKSRKYSAIFRSIEELINPNEIKIFYPKNLFLDDKDLEIYIVLNGKLLRWRFGDDKKIELRILHLKNLKDFKCEGICNEEGIYKIILEFETGEEIAFNSMDDSIDNWKYTFKEHITEIAKTLIEQY